MTSSLSIKDWEAFLAGQTETHLLQTTPWGELKAAFGWDVERVQIDSSGAQVLFRHLPLGITLAYVPKGPIGDWIPELMPSLDSLCKDRNAFVLKIEPDSAWDPELAAWLHNHGFRPSPHCIQPRRTLVIDLEGDEEIILARMHQKTRYNIRLATKKDVHVRPWNDLQGFGNMMLETAERDRFGAHVPEYYRHAYDLFHPSGACEIFVAEYEGQPLAAIMVFANGPRAWYFYGASTRQHRNRMPTYLLQWEAMRWARSRGCVQYDLWGVPDEDQDVLETQFTSRQDGLWGVYRFKRGFGGSLMRTMGAWDRPYNKPLFIAYHWWMSRQGN
ncbi:MAG: peptidoglycan bridge formation glycyltransferase FemA/FemB family protein [Anaerolineales bacterium]|nr:peptidoglycan bridge formation glycyltransferase FemA/FemB family protein [Anaerolineales bacterium]